MPEQGAGTAAVDDGDRLADRLLQEWREGAGEAVVVAAGVERHHDVDRAGRIGFLRAKDRRGAERGGGDAAGRQLQHSASREYFPHTFLLFGFIVCWHVVRLCLGTS
jgi:hypothetical protein